MAHSTNCMKHFQSPTGFTGHLDLLWLCDEYGLALSFQSPTGFTGHLDPYPCSIAWEAVLYKRFREPLFLGVFCLTEGGRFLSALAVVPPVEYPEGLCTTSASLRLSQTVRLIREISPDSYRFCFLYPQIAKAEFTAKPNKKYNQ